MLGCRAAGVRSGLRHRPLARTRGAHVPPRGAQVPPVGKRAAPAPLPARASTIAGVLATPCQNTELMPEPGDIELVRSAVLCLINRERAENGETPLEPNEQLQQAADSHSRDMVAADYFEHVSPSGETPVDRAESSGYIPGRTVGYVIGENLAWGTLDLATPQSVVEAWVASPEHLANILEGQYRDTGIGVVAAAPASLAEGQPGAVYTQEFGVILH